MIFSRTFAEYERLLRQKYRISSTIRHRGEKGRQRENSLLVFLRENLPAAFGVATGEIIPFKGPLPSPQCDIIIYDRLRFPVLGASEVVQQVPLEAVCAVIECKSVLDATALEDAKEKIAAIRALPRCPSQRPLKKDHVRGPFFSVFAYSMRCSTKRCVEFMASTSSKAKDVDVIVLGKGCGIWVTELQQPIWLTASSRKHNLHQSLLLYYIGLLQVLSCVDLGEPSFLKMFFEDE